MNKIKFLALTVAVCFFFSAAANAGVTFLPAAQGVSSGHNRSGREISPSLKCQREGYTRTSCYGNNVLTNRCPYDGSYYKNCCESTFKFSKDDCLRQGLIPSNNSCGGLYQCR